MADDIKDLKETKAKKAPGMVGIRVPRDESDETNVMIVGDNGKYYKLKRGAVVTVPQSVADIIEESEAKKEKAREVIEEIMRKKKAKEQMI